MVEIDPRYYRPTEVDVLLEDAAKARRKLGWTPMTSLEEMVNSDLAEAQEAVTVRQSTLDV